MNDRFKFRLYDKLSNKYWIGGNINADGNVFVIPVDSDAKLCLGYDTVIIEQCTGLKDKNGNLIYEGDRIFDGDYFWQVKWDNYNAQWILSDPEGYETMTEPDAKYLEIIGNVHEQAEQKD